MYKIVTKVRLQKTTSELVQDWKIGNPTHDLVKKAREVKQ